MTVCLTATKHLSVEEEKEKKRKKKKRDSRGRDEQRKRKREQSFLCKAFARVGQRAEKNPFVFVRSKLMHFTSALACVNRERSLVW